MAERDKDLFTAAWAMHRFTEETRRITELVVGRTMRLDVNLNSQEDVPDWNALPADVRQALDAALDALPSVIPGEVVRGG